MVVLIPDLNTGQVKVHYSDASVIQIPTVADIYITYSGDPDITPETQGSILPTKNSWNSGQVLRLMKNSSNRFFKLFFH